MSEAYYAEMEANRNDSEDEYFKARPQADTLANRSLFRAGFERAFSIAYYLEPRHAYSEKETGRDEPSTQCPACGLNRGACMC